MKKLIFIFSALLSLPSLQYCSEEAACKEKIIRILNDVGRILHQHQAKPDAFKAQIIAHIATATIESGSPRIHGLPEKISLKEAERNLLATFATLQSESYDTTSAHEQSRKLYAAAQQYKAVI